MTKYNALTQSSEQAELLYNKITQSMIELDYSDASEQYILDLKTRYNTVLLYLNSNGIGGVRINGIFRYTNIDNCPN